MSQSFDHSIGNFYFSVTTFFHVELFYDFKQVGRPVTMVKVTHMTSEARSLKGCSLYLALSHSLDARLPFKPSHCTMGTAKLIQTERSIWRRTKVPI